MGLPVKIVDDQVIYFTNGTLADLDPHVATSPTGRYLIALTEPDNASDSNISLVVSDRLGSSVYTLGITATVDEGEASVAGLGDGSAVVVYRSTPDGGSSDIYARFLYQDSIPGTFGPEILINVGATAGDQTRPQVTELAYGQIAFAWIDTSSNQIKAAVFDRSGQFVVSNITVSTTPSTQFGGYDIGLTSLSSGNFAVSWRDDAGVDHFRIGSPYGAFQTGDIAIAGDGTTDLTELADGNLLLTYYSSSGPGHFGMIVDAYNGATVVNEFQISSSSGYQAVTALLDGRFMVAYDLGDDIFGRIMNADGTADTDEFRINIDTTGVQDQVDLATTADGRVVVTWADSRTGGGDIYQTIYDPRESGINLAGTAYADDFLGSVFADQISTGNGNDIADGGEGADTIHGGAGNDVLYGEGGNDAIFGGAGNDYISGELFTSGAGNDILDGGLGADVMIGGAGNDTFTVDNAADFIGESAGGGTADQVFSSVSYGLAADAEVELLSTTNAAGLGAINLTGNGFVQSIVGNAGANQLYGGGGGDTLTGLGGNDTYIVGNAGDVIVEGAGGGTADVAFTSVTYALGAAAQVEMLRTTSGTGLTAINLTGNDFVQTIIGNNGVNRLDGKGGADTLQGLGGNDVYVVDNVGDVIVEGAGEGTADSVYANVSYVLGTAAQVELLATANGSGTAAANLTGNGFVQTIIGNDGVNRLDGKGGADVLTGRGGADTFVFSTALNLGIDAISDFSVPSDTIELKQAIFSAAGALGALNVDAFWSSAAGVAHDASDRIIYDTDSGALFYDADGSAAGAAVQFATLTTGLALTNADFVIAV